MQGTETIEGLKLQRTCRVRFSTNAFKEMNRLRLLQFNRVDLTGDYGYLSKELRWVNWQRSTFTIMVAGEAENPQSQSFQVDESIGDLSNLVLINLKDCTSLSNPPGNIYKLKTVKTLILSGCSKIDKLEEDIVQMKSLTTLIAKDTAIKEVPYSIIRSKSIGYISLCGYEGLSRDVFPSLIWSWTSPTMNPFSHIHPFDGMLSSLVSVNVENNNLGNLSPILSSLSKLRSFWVQCRSEIQLTQELRTFLDDLYDRNFTEMETTAHASQVSDLSLKSLLIGMGSYHGVVDALGKTISQGLTTNDSSNIFLPGDNYPSWLAYKGEGPSVHFQVPEDSDCRKKGIILCVVYSSTPENMANGCLSSVLIINYTKLTIQIYKQDTVMSFTDEDWQNVISNLGAGDTVEILVAFGHGLIVKDIAVYLISDQSITMEIESSSIMEVEPFTNKKMELLPAVDVQPSPNVKTESSQEVNVQPSPNVKMEPFHDIETEPSLKPNKNIFTRLKKRMGECLCLNQK
ncbi:Leucine-rich repeat domain superfamily [Sesbania bispinosa]|nr:Leucine-rich repeat domain superfamily [Sesbania bispinosa]